jgi:hypothetical protein
MAQFDPHRDRDLQLDDDVQFARLEWKLQRVAWGTMAIVMLAAVLGLLGASPHARLQTSGAGGRLRVEYDPVERAGRRGALRVHLDRAGSSRVQLWVGRRYAEQMGLEPELPSPSSSMASSDQIRMEFAGVDADPSLEIVFRTEPRSAGRHHAQLGIGDATVQFDQYVLP